MPDSIARVRLLLPLLLAAWNCAPAAEPVRTVILVRHAERAGAMTPDAGLTEAGRCRAGVLAKMLTDAGVTRIYTTEAARTRETAEPLAKKLNLRPEVVPSKEIGGLAAKLRAGAPGGVALVVWHGDTLPEIIRRLGAGTVPPIGDSEYDRLFLVTLAGADRAVVVALRYPGCAR